MKTFIISENRSEYLAYCEERGLSRLEYERLESPSQLCGIREPRFICVGDWLNFSDLRHLLPCILADHFVLTAELKTPANFSGAA